jgi:HK97 gp10 family phage protein
VIGLRFKILDDPDKRLVTMKRALRNRILRKAVRAAAKPVRQAAKANAPRLSGALAASISVRIAVNRRTGAVYAVVGPKRRFEFRRRKRTVSSGTPTKIAHLIEGGVRPHSTSKGDTLGRTRTGKGGKARVTAHRQTGRQHPGFAPRHFLSNAWRSEFRPAVIEMRRVIAAELAKLGGGSGAGESADTGD